MRTLCLIILIVLFLSGCTFQFKASEVEAEGHSNTTYELESISVAQK